MGGRRATKIKERNRYYCRKTGDVKDGGQRGFRCMIKFISGRAYLLFFNLNISASGRANS